MYGVVLGAESEASQSTGAVGENVLPILVMKDKRLRKRCRPALCLRQVIDGIPITVRSSTHAKEWVTTRSCSAALRWRAQYCVAQEKLRRPPAQVQAVPEYIPVG